MKATTYEIYYDEEGDFLEISMGYPPEKEYSEEIEEGVFVTKEESTDQIKSIGILSFRKRAEILRRLLKRFNFQIPFEINFSN